MALVFLYRKKWEFVLLLYLFVQLCISCKENLQVVSPFVKGQVYSFAPAKVHVALLNKALSNG